MANHGSSLPALKIELEKVLTEGIIPFWLKRSVDRECGGFLTCFDEHGDALPDTAKYLVTQSRMIWGFSYLYGRCPSALRPDMKSAAEQGLEFFMSRFWDKKYEGFVWKTGRDGGVLDGGKVVYGQGFAIYALAEYYRFSGDRKALDLAERVFDLLQIYAADALCGGYFENLEADWRPAGGGRYAGDRKSLDIHMHLMEAYTTLYAASGREIHGRKLKEIVDLLLRYMINTELGYAYNQFDREFRRIPAINIYRTWNDEREAGETIGEPLDTTSYGHNVELSWLLKLAMDTLGREDPDCTAVTKKLLDHSLRYGFDYEYGGVYRDGLADQKVLVTDKEWWQNFEALAGYSNGYLCFGDHRYLDALVRTWSFVRDKFISAETGESRQLLRRNGEPVTANMGNPWKGVYHTGRALAVALDRLGRIIEKDKAEV